MAVGGFDRAYPLSRASEGGWSNHKDDPGGATMGGVTQATYDGWRRARGKPRRSVAKITEDEAVAIYASQYWEPIKGDRLPAGVDYAVFDYAINSGPAQAVRDLQRVVGVAADGIVGNITLAAADGMPPAEIINRLCDRRLAFLRSLRHWGTFGRGWAARVARVRAQALEMVGQPVPPDVPAPAAAGAEGAKARPEDRSLARTPEAAGGGLAGLGTVGLVVQDAVAALTPLADTPWIKAALVVLVLAGVAVAIAPRLAAIRDGSGT